MAPEVRAGEASRADRGKAPEGRPPRVLWIPAAGGDVRPLELAAARGALSSQNLLDPKKDLARLRRVIAPERDSINVLLRRDPPILDAAHVFCFQDVYDHLIGVTDSIDNDRDLVTTALDAFPSVENNRLSEIVRRPTMILTIFLTLSFVTGFFGMNFRRLGGAGDLFFLFGLAAMVVLPAGMLRLIRRQRVE